jgi:biopolymer transport protein TolR
MTHGIKVDLPETELKSIKAQEDPLVLTITRKNEIFIENYRVELGDLNDKLRKIFANRAAREILLEADRSVSYGYVMSVMSQVKEAGITKVGMVTEPLRK